MNKFLESGKYQILYFKVLLCAYLFLKMAFYVPLFFNKFKFFHFSYVNLPIFSWMTVDLSSPVLGVTLFVGMEIMLLTSVFINNRFLMLGTGILFLIFNGWRYGLAQMPFTTYSPHDYNAVVIVLLYLGILKAPYKEKRFILHLDHPVQPSNNTDHAVIALRVFLVLIFLQAVYAKMTVVGLQWMDGYHLQQFILWRFLISGNEFGYWFAQSWLLCFLSSIGVIIYQSLAWLLVFLGRNKTIFVFSFFFFLMVRLLLNIDFLTTHFPLFLIFLPLGKIVNNFKKRIGFVERR